MANKRPLSAPAADSRSDPQGEMLDRWHTQMLTTLEAFREQTFQAQRLNDVSAADPAALARGSPNGNVLRCG